LPWEEGRIEPGGLGGCEKGPSEKKKGKGMGREEIFITNSRNPSRNDVSQGKEGKRSKGWMETQYERKALLKNARRIPWISRRKESLVGRKAGY